MGTEGSVAFQFKHCGQLILRPRHQRGQGNGSGARSRCADDVVADDDGAIEVLTSLCRV